MSKPVWVVATTVATTSAVLLAVWTGPATWWRDQPALPTALAVAALVLLAALAAAGQMAHPDERPVRVAAVALGLATVAPLLAVVEPVVVAATGGAERLDLAWSTRGPSQSGACSPQRGKRPR